MTLRYDRRIDSIRRPMARLLPASAWSSISPSRLAAGQDHLKVRATVRVKVRVKVRSGAQLSQYLYGGFIDHLEQLIYR